MFSPDRSPNFPQWWRWVVFQGRDFLGSQEPPQHEGVFMDDGPSPKRTEKEVPVIAV